MVNSQPMSASALSGHDLLYCTCLLSTARVFHCSFSKRTRVHMASMTVHLRSIPDTQAALGWAEGHTIVVDCPDGKAGGMGLGFNGGQLLGLAIGGCFCNDLQYVAYEMGVYLTLLRSMSRLTWREARCSRHMRKCEWRWRRPTNPRMWTASSSARGKSRPSATHLNVACRLNF